MAKTTDEAPVSPVMKDENGKWVPRPTKKSK